ncbi:MAG: sulfite exporter TauE/SafE family protein [Terrisporobacter sp.]|uniref:urease accessory protein UreH domain-containing protein n=1 Tax=Terrisporobacter sp. TaxID=1965305 RepID=UPI002FC83861
MSKITKIFDVYGMKCHSCESAIEDNINILKGITSVSADYKNSMVIVTYEKDLCSDIEIKDKIKTSGFSNNNNLLIKVIVLSILVISMFFLGNNPLTGTSTSSVKNESSFIMLFILGVFTSFHCIGMCGGIMLTQTINKDEKVYDKRSSLKISFLYNCGRVISYTILGGIVGSLGSVFSASTKIQSFLQIVASIFMIISGLSMLGIKIFKTISTPTLFKKNTCVNNHKKPFIIGYLNGFLPCGPLQTMQLYALASGSFIMGASSMFVFSLGTVPLMLSFGYLSSRISKHLNESIYKYVGILIVILGLIMIRRALSII